MTFRAWNRFDECFFTYQSDYAAGTEDNVRDAVRQWNRRHGWYWAIGEPCVVEVVEIKKAA